MNRLVQWEESLWERLVERAAERYPDWFWSEGKRKRPLAWEPYILDFWPRFLTFSYWEYLFGNLEGKGYGSDPYPNWINIPQWGEIRYLFYGWKDNKYGWRLDPKWLWIQLTDETKGQRLICRLRGHPEGEIYYNPGGDEPDHRCQTCGESIG